MNRVIFACLCFGVVAGAARTASAQAASSDLGAQGQWIISADRLSPLLSYSRVRLDDMNNASTTTSTTSLALFWSGEPQDIYAIPRLGLDYVIAPHITIGGNFFATIPMSTKESVTDQGQTVSQDGDKVSAFGIAGRGGYVMSLGPKLAFWARGGLNYARVGTTSPRNNGGDRYTSLSQIGLNLEPQFVIVPGAHVGIMIGPILDVPLSGTYHTERTDNNGQTTSTDFDSSQLHFGIDMSLIVWL